MRLATLLVATLALSACAAPHGDVPDRRAPPEIALPPMKTFAAMRAAAPTRSNRSIAEDFLDLSFRLESGRELDVFTRFEGPVTVRVLGAAPPTLAPDLDRLIARLRDEAGIAITRVGASSDASITVEVLSRSELQRAVPQAACFVVPRVTSWDEFRRNRRSPLLDWTTLRVRERMSVFIPGDVSPQEIRDCLHEELAQALGPLNDLYHLPDSVFNDDNFHTVLTGFDMLILRATYAPELRSGMTRAEVAARLPAILARLNPRGEGQGTLPRSDTSARLDPGDRDGARAAHDLGQPTGGGAHGQSQSPAPAAGTTTGLASASMRSGGSRSAPSLSWRSPRSFRPGRSSPAAGRRASTRRMWGCSLPPSRFRPDRRTWRSTSPTDTFRSYARQRTRRYWRPSSS
jgi:hypothetical protein